MSLKAEVSRLKQDIDQVDQCLHDDLFSLEERVSVLEEKAKAEVAKVVSEVKAEASKL